MNEKVKVYDGKMTKTINNLDSELATIRAGRAERNRDLRGRNKRS